jgi:DNA-binding response OmpR family regulator
MENRPLILAASANRRNLELLAEFFEREGWSTLRVNSLAEFDHALNDSEKISVALLDLAGFDQSVWAHCEHLRELGVPFLVISPRQSAEVQRESIAQGARGMLVKPVAVKELIRLISGLLGA